MCMCVCGMDSLFEFDCASAYSVFPFCVSVVFVVYSFASACLQCFSAILCLQVPRIAANLGAVETNYEALVDLLNQDDIQVADTLLDPENADYCQRRTRKYAWWFNMEAAARRTPGVALDPFFIQELLEKTAECARTLGKSVKYGIELKHFLFAHDSQEILQEKDALQKELKVKLRRLEKMQSCQQQDEPGSKRQKNNDGQPGLVMNSGVQKKTKSKKQTQSSGGDDDFDKFMDDLVGEDGAAEPKWFDIHRNIHEDLGCPGVWSPVDDKTPPQRYVDNVFYNSLRWRDRDIINMLDLLSPPESLDKEVGVDLHPWHV